MQIAEALLCEARLSYSQKKAHLNLHEFLEVYERVTRGLQRSARQHKIAAQTPQKAVPQAWLTADALHQVYASACLRGETRRSLRVAAKTVSGLNSHQWLSIFRNGKLLTPEGPVTEATVDLAFVVGRGKQQRLSFSGFCAALAHVSSDVGFDIVDLLLKQFHV
jgi:hypothetical protein